MADLDESTVNIVTKDLFITGKTSQAVLAFAGIGIGATFVAAYAVKTIWIDEWRHQRNLKKQAKNPQN